MQYKNKKIKNKSHYTQHNRTHVSNASKTLKGIVTITRGGIGFFMHEDLQDDIKIDHDLLNTALNGDTIEIVRLPRVAHSTRDTGKVIQVLERARMSFVGTLKYEKGEWLLVPDNPRVYTNIHIIKQDKELKEGNKALIKITHWDNPQKLPEGELLQNIGKAGEHETEMQAILLERGFESNFPPEVEKEAHLLQETARKIPKEEVEWREDFRSVPTFTIDPTDSKDFDDALSLRTLENNNYEIGIHIADVTHYVHPKSALDTEAQKRATSVYLVDRTIPMLPEGISNDLCSLNPNEEKRAFSVLFEITPSGKVSDYRFAKTLIESNQRFTYRSAQDVIDGDTHTYEEELRLLWKLSQLLRAERVKKGTIEFESDEIAFELSSDGTPLKAYIKEKLNTMKLIEEFMLLANRTVAEHIAKHCKGKNPSQSVGIYRVHDAPDPDKLAELSIFLRALGYDNLNKEPHQIKARDIAGLLKDIKGTPEEAVIQMATLRSMAKAVYSDKNVGHFSLGFSHYTNFTSPIRRYPDIMVHRILFAHIKGTSISKEEIATYRQMALQSSQREVEAVRAERDSVKFKQIEYMRSHVGEKFNGTITGVSKGGMFVSENETHGEGMVRMNAIPGDWFEIDEKNYRIVGRKTRKKYRIGDTVRIKLKRADTEARELDWEIVA